MSPELLVERLSARVAALEAERNELALELAYSLDDVFNLGHALKGAATALKCSQRNAESYRTHRDQLMAKQGSVQRCGEDCAKREAA